FFGGQWVRSNLNVDAAVRNPLSIAMVYSPTVNGRGLYGNDNGNFDLGHFTSGVLGWDNFIGYPGGDTIGQPVVNRSCFNHCVGACSFVYINNKPVLNFTYNNASGGNAYLDIGVNGQPCGSCENYFYGTIPEYILYNRTLTAAEAQRL